VKKKFDDLSENLDEFAEQSDYSVLLIGCTPADAPYVAQFLDGVDQSHPHDLVVTFVEPFVNAERYVDAVVRRVAEQRVDADEVRSGRGESPFAPLPAELEGPELVPAERLARVLEFLASLLPNPREHAFVVAFLPFERLDDDGFSELLEQAVLARESAEWMASLRVIVADDRHERRLARRSRERERRRVLYCEVDFSTAALTDALSNEAADPSVPRAQRMANLLQLAALDFSYRRFDAALEKYAVLYEYYRDPPLPVMQVLCLQGRGDCLRASGQPEAGKRALQSGIALALEQGALVPLVGALLSIVDVCAALGEHEDAESYADSGLQVSQACMNAPVYVTLVEKKADAQLAQARAADAVETYRRCLRLAEMYEQFLVWTSVLQKLRALYAGARMRAELEAVERELVRVARLEAQRTGADRLRAVPNTTPLDAVA
jgi:tetratricopeptide (TPR) repeat protein